MKRQKRKERLMKDIELIRSVTEVNLKLASVIPKCNLFPVDIMADLLMKYTTEESILRHYNVFVKNFNCDVEMYKKYSSLVRDRYLSEEFYHNLIPIEWMDKYIETKQSGKYVQSVAQCIKEVISALSWIERVCKIDICTHIPQYLTVDGYKGSIIDLINRDLRDCFDDYGANAFKRNAIIDPRYNFRQLFVIFRILKYTDFNIEDFDPSIDYEDMLYTAYHNYEFRPIAFIYHTDFESWKKAIIERMEYYEKNDN